MFTPRRQSGLSLIELVMFIVIVGVAVAGVLSVMNITTQHSADPMVRKQALAIAESLLEEIELQPFTWCDPTDANAAIATSSSNGNPVGSLAGCVTLPEAMGPEPGESRYSTTTPFNNVNDYDGFTMSPIVDITNTGITGLNGYSATVRIVQVGTSFSGIADNTAVLKIDVTVSAGTDNITLTGYRFRYAPNAVP